MKKGTRAGVMNIWTILGIGQTDDKGAIKQAYRERLKSVNPEEDADGFMELRNAYEEAIASCERQEALPEDMDDEASEGLQPPRTELTDKLEQLYNDYPNRIRVDAWRELFREDAFVSLGTEAEALEELLVFLMDHYRMPDAVFREIVDRFDIALRKEDLLVKFPEDYISYILGVAARKQDGFAYEYLTGDYTYADDYIEQYMKIERMDKQDEPTPENRTALHKELERLKQLPLTHPHGDVLEIYVQMKDTRLQEKDAEQPLPRAEAEAVYEALLSRINANLERYPKDEMTQFIKSEMLYRLERYEEAKQTAEEILAENPDYEDAQYCLGDIYYAMGDLEKAKDIFEELMHNNYGDMAYLTRLQQVNEAIIEKWKQDVDKHPEDHQKKLDLAWCYYQNQREPEALEVFDTFEPEGDEIFFYCNAKGRCYLAIGQTEKALPLFLKWKKAIEDIQPEEGGYTEEQNKRRKRYPYAHTLIANCYYNLKEYEKAKEYIQLPVETEHEEQITGLILNLRILYELREYGNCMKACDEMLEHIDYESMVYEDEYWAHCYRAKCCYMLDYLQECIYSAEKAIRIYPYGVEPYIQEILTFQQAEQYEDAENVMAQYREFRPESDAMDYYEALNLRAQEKSEEALKLLEKVEANYKADESDLPNYEDLLLELADLYDEANRNEESIAVYKKVASINPKNPDVFGYLGYMYRKVHETDLAIKAYEDQICVRPHAAYYTNLGFIYWERRDYEKALENFEQSLAIAPERSDRDIRRKTEVIRFKSRVLLCLNRITEGCQILLDAIHKYGDDMDPQLRIEAGLALTRADRYPEAEQLLESYAEEGTDESLRFDCASLLMELAGEEDDTLMMDQMYQLGIKLKPDNTSIYSKYGRVLIMSGRYADAVDAYKKAVNLNKETNYYGELLQALYLRDGEIKSEYAEYLSKAVIPEEDRKTPLDYIKLARYCRVIGDYADAEKYLKQAVSMKVCSSCGYHGCEEGYYELGILYEVMGERKMAIEAYEKAIEAHGHCYVYEKRLQDLLENS